jgi:type IV secretory pathway VirB10-like protein
MLPDIRAVIAATVAVIGLLLISFALVTTYRVAQQHQAGSLQADLAKRGRAASPAQSGERHVPIIEPPGPHLAVPVQAAEPAAIMPPPATVRAPPVPEPAPPTPVAAAPQPPAEPPIGGPLAALPESSRSVAAENPSRVDSGALQRAAAEKARKARAARIARERKAAARRAAQARRARQQETPSFGTNSGSFGGTFTAPTSQPRWGY